MQKKIRDAQLQKIPYMLVVGDRESADKAVAAVDGEVGAVTLAAMVVMGLEIRRCVRKV